MKISIIIPVYNTGAYLKRCIDSILKQTHENLDIIIVDDGSFQETSDICDSLADLDSRIRVFHKMNEGVSVARNFGLAQAIGDYIGFVDSDDWIKPDMYESMLLKLLQNNVDVVYCDAFTVYNTSRCDLDTFVHLSISQQLDSQNVTPSILFEIAGSVWRGLYKRTLLDGVKFPVCLKFSEDRYFNLQVLSKAKHIYYLKEAYYYRYMRVDSCVNSYHQDALQVTCNGFNLMANFVERFWGDAYSDEYRRNQMLAFIGLLYRSLHCGKGFLGRYNEFKRIACATDIHNLISKYGSSDLRLKMVKKKCYFPLFLLIVTHSKIKNY